MVTDPAILQVNDAALSMHQGGQLLASSPGYAVADGQALLLGEAARNSARLNPRNSANRFWAELDQQPLRRPLARARHHADLAYFHLKSVLDMAGRAEEYFLVVPPAFNSDQLALLLGISQSLGMHVTGLVAAPLLAPVDGAGDASATVFDIGLHGVSEAELKIDESLNLSGQQWITRQGLSWLAGVWAGQIARRFVSEARFDPLHDAQIEQRLYDQLDDWREAAGEADSLRLDMPAGDRIHTVTMERAEWRDAAPDLYAGIRSAIESAQGQVLVSERLAGLPGLLDGFESRVSVFNATQLAAAAAEQGEAIRSDAEAPAFVTRLPLRADHRAVTQSVTKTVRSAATHALQGHVAKPLKRILGEQLEAPDEQANQALTLIPHHDEIRINGSVISEPVRLLEGDRLTVAGADWQLIRVED